MANSTNALQVVRNKNNSFIGIFSGTLLEKAIAQIKKSLTDNNRYYCKKTELKTEDIVNLIVDDTVCQDTCPLKTFNLPNGVILEKVREGNEVKKKEQFPLPDSQFIHP